jgi:hypothetical protein
LPEMRASIHNKLKIFCCGTSQPAGSIDICLAKSLAYTYITQIDSEAAMPPLFSANMRLAVVLKSNRRALPQAALHRASCKRCLMSSRNRRSSSTFRPSRASTVCRMGSSRRSSSEGSGLLVLIANPSNWIVGLWNSVSRRARPAVCENARMQTDDGPSSGAGCCLVISSAEWEFTRDHDQHLTPGRPLR